MKRANNFRSLIGNRYGRLKVVSFFDITKCGMSRWRCVCDCGTETTATIGNLKCGHTQSCGCLSIESCINRSTTHGRSGTREFIAWSSAKQRCYYARSNRYYLYGNRGIKMCEGWRKSFEAFFEHMGICPNGYSLDRIDTNGNYEPGNCRWASKETQARNTRFNRMVSVNERTLPAVVWDIELGFPKGTVRGRLHRGWSDERAVTQPMRRHFSR